MTTKFFTNLWTVILLINNNIVPINFTLCKFVNSLAIFLLHFIWCLLNLWRVSFMESRVKETCLLSETFKQCIDNEDKNKPKKCTN